MISLISEALWFFLPAFAANQCPGLTSKLNLPGNFPVSRRWLGSNKTWSAYYTAAIGSLLTIYAQRSFHGVNASIGLFDYDRSDVWVVGLLFGVGAVLGDHTKSFFKRRIGIKPRERWWPFDALDFVVGGFLATLPIVGWIGWKRILVIVLVWLVVHPIGNKVGYCFGLRTKPW